MIRNFYLPVLILVLSCIFVAGAIVDAQNKPPAPPKKERRCLEWKTDYGAMPSATPGMGAFCQDLGSGVHYCYGIPATKRCVRWEETK